MQNETQLDSSEPTDTATLEELPPSFEQVTEDGLVPDPPKFQHLGERSRRTASYKFWHHQTKNVIRKKKVLHRVCSRPTRYTYVKQI